MSSSKLGFPKIRSEGKPPGTLNDEPTSVVQQLTSILQDPGTISHDHEPGSISHDHELDSITVQSQSRSRLNRGPDSITVQTQTRSELNHNPDSVAIRTQSPGLNNTYAKIVSTRNYKQNFTKVNSYKGNSRYKRCTQYLR